MTDERSRLIPLILLLAGLVAVTALGVAPPAAAAAKKQESCAKQVVADWYGDGRVDKIFPQKCYRDAIRSLPVDVLDYSNAKEDILRALAFARQGKPDPGDAGGPAPSGSGGNGSGGANGGGANGGTETGTTPGETTGGGSQTEAVDPVDTSGPSSLPIPLLVLGGLAILLLAAGGAGYLNRRLQSRRPGGDGPPGAV